MDVVLRLASENADLLSELERVERQLTPLPPDPIAPSQ
jgi:hypothetical protein